MVVNKKVTGRAASMPGGLALGSGIAMVLTILLAIITAKLVDAGTVGEGSIGYMALGILLLSSGSGAAVAAAKIKRRRLLVCMGAGAVYYGLLLALTALFFGGQYTGMGVTALVVAGGAATVCFAGMGQGRGGEKRRFARVSR